MTQGFPSVLNGMDLMGLPGDLELLQRGFSGRHMQVRQPLGPL